MSCENSYGDLCQPGKTYLQQCCPEAMATYSYQMPHLLFRDFMCSAITSIVNVVVFATYSSPCAVYFEKCGQHCCKGTKASQTQV